MRRNAKSASMDHDLAQKAFQPGLFVSFLLEHGESLARHASEGEQSKTLACAV